MQFNKKAPDLRIESNRKQELIHYLLLQSNFIEDTGLLYGKMGVSVFFYHYSQYTNQCRLVKKIR
jgi:hypothetical protein